MRKWIFTLTCLLFSIVFFSQEKTSDFKLCDSTYSMPYYHPDLTYEGGFWEIKNHFKINYPVSQFQELENNTGIITVQFWVNCKGEPGKYKLLFCDFNYKPSSIHTTISDYFLLKTKELKNWIPGTHPKGYIVNSHKFFSFRIKEGVLLEILPK